MAFSDFRVFYLNTKRFVKIDISKIYTERILEIGHERFTPLVMSATARMSRECKKFHLLLPEIISSKRSTNENIAVWIKRSLFPE